MDTLKNMYTVVKSYSVDPICDFFASHYVDKTQIAFSVVVGIVVYNIVVGYLDAKDAAKKDKEANSESEIPSNSSSECKVEVSSECKVEVEVLPIPSSGVELESVSSNSDLNTLWYNLHTIVRGAELLRLLGDQSKISAEIEKLTARERHDTMVTLSYQIVVDVILPVLFKFNLAELKQLKELSLREVLELLVPL